MASSGTESADRASPPRRIIVAGYGPVGRVVADQLEAEGVAVTIIELNAATVDRQATLGKHIVYGDVTDPETLERAGIHDADALILAIPNEDDALRACTLARQLAPHIFIAARTNFVSKGLLARQAGADYVVVEEVVTAQAMQRAVMEHLLARNKTT